MISLAPNDRLFVLTGAGISAESGLPTFRDPDGLWQKYPPEKVATPEAWRRNPRMVWEFYSERRRRAAAVKPNAAHYALARLEEKLGERMLICTQNVDPLHELAGSRHVVHMHGELMKSRCDRCSRPSFADEQLYVEQVPRCSCGGQIRPHVCWFGEVPYEMDSTMEWLAEADVFVTIGSSGTVEPAASFALWAGRNRKPRKGERAGGSDSAVRARCFYIGAEEPQNSMLFDRVFIGKAGDLVPKLFVLEEAAQQLN